MVADFIDLCLDSRFWGPTLIQIGDIIHDDNGMRFDGVELVPRKHVVPEYGVVVRSPGDDWHSGISYTDGDFANWVVPVGKGRDLGLLLKCCPSCISKKNMLAFWDMFGEIFGQPMRIAHTSSPDENERRRIEESLQNMGRRSGHCFRKAPTLKSRKAAAAMLTMFMTSVWTVVTLSCQKRC